jgi:hypothetical protein
VLGVSLKAAGAQIFPLFHTSVKRESDKKIGVANVDISDVTSNGFIHYCRPITESSSFLHGHF